MRPLTASTKPTIAATIFAPGPSPTRRLANGAATRSATTQSAAPLVYATIAIAVSAWRRSTSSGGSSAAAASASRPASRGAPVNSCVRA